MRDWARNCNAKLGCHPQVWHTGQRNISATTKKTRVLVISMRHKWFNFFLFFNHKNKYYTADHSKWCQNDREPEGNLDSHDVSNPLRRLCPKTTWLKCAQEQLRNYNITRKSAKVFAQDTTAIICSLWIKSW